MYKRGVGGGKGVVGEICVSGGGSGGGMWVYVWQQQHKCLAKLLQATHRTQIHVGVPNLVHHFDHLDVLSIVTFIINYYYYVQ